MLEKYTIKVITFSFLSTFIVTLSFADDIADQPYFAADWGIANYSTAPIGYPSQTVMTRIAVGYLFIPTLAAELGYSMFGDLNNNPGTVSGTITASSLQLAIVGNLPLSSRFSLFGKIGLAGNNQKIDSSVGSMSESANSVLIAGGLQYHLRSQLSIRAQYDNFGNFGKLDASTGDMSVSAFSLGVVAIF
jgi:opacity protein-like surface antigen